MSESEPKTKPAEQTSERASANELAWRIAEADYDYIRPVVVDKQELSRMIAQAIREAEQAAYQECREIALEYGPTPAGIAREIADKIQDRMTGRRVSDLLYGRG